MTTKLLGTLLLALTMTVTGCGGDDDGGGGGGDADGGGGGGDTDGGGSTTDGGDTTFDGGLSPSELCGGDCACSDGMDNDGDGLIDGMDPECTSPYDNDEGSFATGIPGDNVDPNWQDCFFDGNSGHGDDGCRYHTDCLTGDKEATDPDCTVTEMCLDFCRARTPNGCDCFGCCEITKEDGTVTTVQIGEDCSLATIDECTTCVMDDECTNECGECELCPGREAEDLPDSCYDDPDGGTPMYECEDGVTCTTSSDCTGDEYCSLGCCLSGPI